MFTKAYILGKPHTRANLAQKLALQEICFRCGQRLLVRDDPSYLWGLGSYPHLY